MPSELKPEKVSFTQKALGLSSLENKSLHVVLPKVKEGVFSTRPLMVDIFHGLKMAQSVLVAVMLLCAEFRICVHMLVMETQ